MDQLLYEAQLRCLWGVAIIVRSVDMEALCATALRIEDPHDRQLVMACCELLPKLPAPKS